MRVCGFQSFHPDDRYEVVVVVAVAGSGEPQSFRLEVLGMGIYLNELNGDRFDAEGDIEFAVLLPEGCVYPLRLVEDYFGIGAAAEVALVRRGEEPVEDLAACVLLKRRLRGEECGAKSGAEN